MRAIRLLFYQAPGDTLMATAALECLHEQYPGRYVTDVYGTDTEAIFANNPHVTKLPDDTGCILMGNFLIDYSDKRPVHVLENYTYVLSRNLKIDLKLTKNRPFLYLTEEEKKSSPFGHKRYWLLNAGVKQDDMPVKGYPHYQDIVHHLRGRVQFIQIGLAEHLHPPLEGVIDLRGKTSSRDLIRLAYHAQGGLGGQTFLQGIFAALSKPYVCLCSGFLPASWVQYPTQTLLTRAAAMPCCQGRGACWRYRLTPLGDSDERDRHLCELPVTLGDGRITPRCLDLIPPSEVAGAVLSYYSSGLLQI